MHTSLRRITENVCHSFRRGLDFAIWVNHAMGSSTSPALVYLLNPFQTFELLDHVVNFLLYAIFTILFCQRLCILG